VIVSNNIVYSSPKNGENKSRLQSFSVSTTLNYYNVEYNV